MGPLGGSQVGCKMRAKKGTGLLAHGCICTMLAVLVGVLSATDIAIGMTFDDVPHVDRSVARWWRARVGGVVVLVDAVSAERVSDARRRHNLNRPIAQQRTLQQLPPA